jgi:transcriptional regulator with XRE-family HTH domain
MRVTEPTWPYREFMQYLRVLMSGAGIADHVELYRAADVAQSVFSRWERGESQPGRANLRKIAAVLNVPPAKLFVAAGHMDEGELDVAAGMIDPATLPAEIREFVDLYLDARLSDEQRRYARRVVADVTSGLRAELARSQVKPIKRRHAG